MKISVMPERCEGHGLCEEAAPEVFQLDDDGNVILLFGDQELPAEQADRANRAVHTCPVAALRIQS